MKRNLSGLYLLRRSLLRRKSRPMFMLDRVSIRYRLSLGHAVWVTLLFLGVAIGFYKVVEKSLYDSVDAALASSARAVRDSHELEHHVKAATDPLLGNDTLQNFFEDPWHLDPPFAPKVRVLRPYAQIIHVSGKVQSRSENVQVNLPVTPHAVARAEAGLMTFETFDYPQRPPLRQITLPVMARGEFTGELIQVGASLMQTMDTLKGIALSLWIVWPCVLIMSVFFGYLLTVRSLKPVRQITRAAQKLGIADLSIRLPVPLAHDELRDLSITFNSMLDRLEDAVKRLRRFAGDVSHELRTPLAVLRGEAELAMRRERTPQEYTKALQVISKESSHMTEIIEDLLLLARAESNSVAMHMAELSAKAFSAGLVDSVKAVFEQREVQLQVELIPEDFNFLGAKGYLSLALKNILFNASKHSGKGATVYFSVMRWQGDIIFTITDQGEGIPSEALPFVFDPFFRADTARNRATGGAGIGLSLALALIKLHGGKIEVQSVLHQGSTFCSKIPDKLR